MNYLGKMCNYILHRSIILCTAVLIVFAYSSLTFAQDIYQAKIPDPSLSYLNTNNGLDQDTINDIVIDKQGFVWLATDEGLNRFDGAQVLQVTGKNDELVSTAVNKIFEHSSGSLFISTLSDGVFILDLQTREVKALINRPYKFEPDWIEPGVAFQEASNGDVYIALEQTIYRYGISSQTLTEIYQMPQEDFESGKFIRSIFASDTMLFFGTNYQLKVISLDSLKVTSIYGDANSYSTTRDVKYLNSFDGSSLLVGTVEGLLHFSLGEIKNHIDSDWNLPAPKTLIAVRNIWDMQQASSELAFVGTDIGLFQLNLQSLEYEYLFKPMRGYQVLSNIDIRALATDRDGNVWFGTQLSGAMLWSPNSLSFTNIYNAVFTKADKILSNNIVKSLYQYSPDTLYVGTENGLNQLNLETQEVKQYLVETEMKGAWTESEILQINSTERGYLWINTGDGLRYFGVEEGRYLDYPFRSKTVSDALKEYAYSVHFEGKDKIWVLNVDAIRVIDRTTESVTEVDLENTGLSIANVMSFIGSDVRTGKLLVSTSAQLWGIDEQDYSWTLLHSIKEEKVKPTVQPTQLIRGLDNIAWLVYAGHGMYKLNGNSLATTEYYSNKNVLPTNLIYDVFTDIEGRLWFSSHAGIHVFNPKDLSTESFSFLNGLATSEFNLDAAERLSDGRLVYGSNLGITIFKPADLLEVQSNQIRKPILTEVQLSSRQLSLPLTRLNDSHITLEHDDLGLSLHFSTLSYDLYANSRFNYRIIHDSETINYPSINSTKLALPTLAPGDYQIEIYSASNQDNDNVARLYVSVKYPLFASPLAYFLYALIVISLIIIFYLRRRRVQRIVEEAHLQVNIYNKRLKEALVASSSDIWEWEAATGYMRGERIKAELSFDSQSDQIPFDEYIAHIHEYDRSSFESTWRAFINEEETRFDITYRIRSLNGKVLWYRDVGSLNKNTNGNIEVKGTYSNITNSIAAQDKLKLFGNAFKQTRDWVLIFNKDKRLIATNPSFQKAIGVQANLGSDFNREKLMSKHQSLLNTMVMRLTCMKPGERYKTESHLNIEGKDISVLTDINAVADEQYPELVDFYLIIATDITEQMLAQKELQKLANYDVLTGLDNRTLLMEKLKHSIHFSYRHGAKLAALFIDLDRFKPINDSFGHSAGDTVLSEIAVRVAAHFSQQDSIARIGGDEFVVIIEEANDIHDVNTTVIELLKVIEAPILIGKQSVSVSASIGIAMYPEDADNAENLIRNADIAMYSAKQAGKNRYQRYTQTMNDQIQTNTILQNRVKLASANKEFVNYYQAVVDIETGKNAGFEMLMRWIDDDNFISPAQFIPIAEQIGCIVEMTMNAIHKAIYDVSTWYAQGFDGYVAINLSAKQFSTRPDFEAILGWLAEYKLPTSCLRFEITEGLLIDNDNKTLACMHEMRSLGFKIALDDFGTGYSSLKYIKDFPLDALKIDRSFVQDMMTDKGTQSIVQSTLIMTRLLGLDTVAEGVETEDELRYFQDSECRYVQGFYFAKPMPAEKIGDILFTNWLQRKNPKNNLAQAVNGQTNSKVIRLNKRAK